LQPAALAKPTSHNGNVTAFSERTTELLEQYKKFSNTRT